MECCGELWVGEKKTLWGADQGFCSLCRWELGSEGSGGATACGQWASQCDGKCRFPLLLYFRIDGPTSSRVETRESRQTARSQGTAP